MDQSQYVNLSCPTSNGVDAGYKYLFAAIIFCITWLRQAATKQL